MSIDLDHQTGVYLGLYERELHFAVRRLCQAGGGTFDIGAHRGYYALIFAALSGARVLCVDESATMCAAIAENARLNTDLAPLLEVRQAFVCAATVESARRTTIDDLAATAFPPHLIKLDIEGGEVDAIEGASKTLREQRPHLIVETHTRELEQRCFVLLRKAGYEPQVIEQRRFLNEHRSGENRWLIAKGDPQTAQE
jgi:hypothetical protein